MAAEGRTETAPVGSPDLEEAVRGAAYSFDFGQAVRVLRRLHPDRRGVGGFAHPSDEVIRFSSNPSLAFPAGEVQDMIREPDTPDRMEVNFMGLVGNVGVLPLHYSKLVQAQERAGRPALRRFLDIFQHRLVSFFYRAWEITRFFVPFERGEGDPVSARLLELIGLGSPTLRNRMKVPDRDLLFYAGLLGMQQRNAMAMQRIIEDYFQVPADVVQFVGGWYPISSDSLCRLDDDGDDLSAGLGQHTVIGDEIWDPQARVRLRIGPLSRERYDEFLPGGKDHEALTAIADFFGGGEFEFELQLVLAGEDVPPVVLGGEGAESTPLGWCTWMRTRPFERDADETTLTL